MGRGLILAIALPVLGCAGANKPVASSSLPPLPRSSIAAVLEHRDELSLSEEQVHRLEELDQQLEHANASIRAEVTPPQKQGGFSLGGGPSGAGMGARGTGRMGGRSPGEPRSNSPDGARRPKLAQQRMDDNDTQAYLEAENILTDAQQPRAREIASHYREELWNRREEMHKRGNSNRK